MQIINIGNDNKLEEAVSAFILDWNQRDSLVVKTSGSTGKPKEITHQKSQFVNSAKRTIDFFGINSESKLYLSVSPNSIAGKMMISRSIVADCKLMLGRIGSNPIIDENSIPDFIAIVPIQLEHLISNNLQWISKIKSILVGGAPISPKLELRIKELQLPIFHSFGMTETLSHVAIRNILKDEYYRAMEGVEFEVSDNDELIINDRKLDITRLQTHDQVELIDPFTFKWLGRTDNTINSGGIKIQPEEVERKLSALIPSRFISVGLPDEILGSKHVLIIEGFPHSIEKSLLEMILGKYELPKEVYFIDYFEVNAGGKIDRLKMIEIIKNESGSIL